MKHNQKRKKIITDNFSIYQPFDFRVLVHGKPVYKYKHEGEVFFEARPGTEYVLELKNNSNQRALAVMSVDGLSICDGEPASYDSIGYIVEPYGSLKVPGWSLNDEEVARFKFGKKGDSYASKKGKKRDVGVIGCAVFYEASASLYEKSGYNITYLPYVSYYVDPSPWTKPSYDYTYITNSTGEPVQSTTNNTITFDSLSEVKSRLKSMTDFSPDRNTVYNCNSVQNVGTEFGRKDGFKVETTSFERQDEPVCIFTFRYDDRNGLEERGIKVSRKKVVEVATPFPAEKTIGCKPPRGWKGE